jgi:probable rRNA maturation factor
MPLINFFEEDVTYKLKHKTALRHWITETILTEGYELKELSYIFCSDNYLLQLNRQYLNHDTYTDIITFDNSETAKMVTGDIFISLDRIRENAAAFGTAEADELHRVIIHGALHLLGYKDKTPAAKQKMTEKEDFYLNKRGFCV